MRTVPNIAGPPTQVAINMAPAIIIKIIIIMIIIIKLYSSLKLSDLTCYW